MYHCTQMNQALILLIISCIGMLSSVLVSIWKRDNIRVQLVFLLVLAFSTGMFTILASAMKEKTLLIWPLFMILRMIQSLRMIFKQLNMN